MIRPLIALTIALAWAAVVPADDKPPELITGRVVDAEGRPVADVDVATSWSANGWKLDAAGRVIGATDQSAAGQARFWGNEGRMEPMGSARTGSDGTFRVETGVRDHHVVAMTADRKRGGLGIVPVGVEEQPIVITLAPLVHVRGQIRGPRPGVKPSWTHIYAERAEEPERPVDLYRVAGCGSFDARFAMLLPAGHYWFDAHNDPEANTEEVRGRVKPAPELTIAGTEGEVDLGILQLVEQPETTFDRTRKLQAEHKLPVLGDWVGRTPPPVFAADARGIPRDWQPGRAGKWQLVYFWGRDCPFCITRTMPALMNFQEQHVAQADRFEIVSVFIDVDGKTRTVAAMDEVLAPLVRHVWKGKAPPFPTLVDPTSRTVESYGLTGYGEAVLINPEGKVVAGDLETLRGILDGK